VPCLIARLIARTILATRWIDAAHSYFDKARSRVVVRLASEQVLMEFNALAYQKDKTYVPGAEQFRHHLFAWESATIRAHFPDAPARLLVGGAGGGREVFSLADRGYEIVAFEPAAELAAGMAEKASTTSSVRVFRSRYETLPRLDPARAGEAAGDLRALAPFDAALMGWGSFSHLMSEESRIRALESMAAVVDGPIMVSFLAFRTGGDTPARITRHRDDAFSAFIGYYHVSTPTEIQRLAGAAGLEVYYMESDEAESSWPHVLLRRRTADQEGDIEKLRHVGERPG
jgi:hypothetical protein